MLGLARSSIGDPDDRTTAGAIGKVVWNELLAIEPQAASTFYENIVGYNANAIERRGGEYIMLTKNGSNRAGILANPGSDSDALWLTYFGVDDPRTAAARAEALGGRIILPPSDDLRDGTMAVITDPGGAVLALRKWPL